MNARAYYNENDAFAAQWLRNLIASGQIAPGDVDERSIVDVRPGELSGYTQCHFFAGIGGWSYALRLAVWPDDRSVWTGSCPCQPFSLAGKRQGFADDRHLWPVWRSLIENCRPGIVFGEQVASAAEWLGLVRGDMGAMGYAFAARPFEAASAGADHLRDRYGFIAADLGNASSAGLAFGSVTEVERGDLWRERSSAAAPGHRSITMADADEPCASEERPQRGGQQCGAGSDPQACAGGDLAVCSGKRFDGSESAAAARGRHGAETSGLEWVVGADGKARRVKPGIRLLANGIPNRVGLLRGFGNAIDPRAFAQFILASQEAIGDLTCP